MHSQADQRGKFKLVLEKSYNKMNDFRPGTSDQNFPNLRLSLAVNWLIRYGETDFRSKSGLYR